MAGNKKDNKSMILIVGPEWLADVKSPNMVAFSSITMLFDYLFQNNDDDATRFQLVLPSTHLQSILDRRIADLEKVYSIDVFYQSAVDLAVDLKYHQQNNKKITHRLTVDLKETLASMTNSNTSSQTIPKPKQSPKRKKKSKSKKYETSVTNNADISCHRCSKIMNDPFQLPCGHRQCKFCIDRQDGKSIKCIECSDIAPRDKVWLDRGFQREIEKLKPTTIFNEE